MTTPKLLRSIALLFIPIVLYYGVFITFEPNNYFGLHEKATGTDIIATLRAYEDNPADAVVLGDSRMAQFDMELLADALGESRANLSYGGASFKEQLDLVDWAIKTNPDLRTVVFGLSFYTLNAGYNHDRMVIRALNNPFVYMTNLGYNINMLTNLKDVVTGVPLGAGEETMDPADYTYMDYTDPVTGDVFTLREKIATHLQEVYPRSVGWQVNQEQLERLLETIDNCADKGISFTVVLPPVHDDVRFLVTDPLGIAEPMAAAVALLRQSPAAVLDYETDAVPELGDTMFYDGFHLDTQRGLPLWTQMLATDVANNKP